MDEVELSPLMRDFLTKDHDTEPAAEELRVALNDIIARHHLHPSAVISLLARMSAAYIHLTQKHYNQKCTDEVVEEDFHNFLITTLTSLDMNDVGVEMERMKNLDYN